MIAVACLMSIVSITFCLFVLHRSRTVADAIGRRALADRGELDRKLETIARQVEELHQEPAAAGPVKPGLNLSKRSQALRMHRRGDQPSAIAAALEVPCQEIELLIKVHRIVLSSI